MNLVDSIIQLFKDVKVKKAFQKQYDEDVKVLKIKLLYKMNADLQKKLYTRFKLESPESIVKSHEGGGKKVSIVLTRFHYIEHAANELTFEQIQTFAEANRIPTNDILNEQKHLVEIYLMNIGKLPLPTDEIIQVPPALSGITKEIIKFEPKFRYNFEWQYHEDLFNHLKIDYPHAKSEPLTNDIKPDITIGKIAIELKGPTRHIDLQSVYAKCFEYLTEYEFLLIVLYDIRATAGQFQKFKSNVKRYFPRSYIVVKDTTDRPQFINPKPLQTFTQPAPKPPTPKPRGNQPSPNRRSKNNNQRNKTRR